MCSDLEGLRRLYVHQCVSRYTYRVPGWEYVGISTVRYRASRQDPCYVGLGTTSCCLKIAPGTRIEEFGIRDDDASCSRHSVCKRASNSTSMLATSKRFRKVWWWAELLHCPEVRQGCSPTVCDPPRWSTAASGLQSFNVRVTPFNSSIYIYAHINRDIDCLSVSAETLNPTLYIHPKS